MIWSRSAVADLRRHVAAGLSGREIGVKFGCSRAAVLGKSHRLGIRLPKTSAKFSRSGPRGSYRARRDADCGARP